MAKVIPIHGDPESQARAAVEKMIEEPERRDELESHLARQLQASLDQIEADKRAAYEEIDRCVADPDRPIQLAVTPAGLRALDELDTEPPPATQPADPLEEVAAEAARQAVRRARAASNWSELSDYHKARIALEHFDELIQTHPRDPVWTWSRARFVDGLPKIVRDNASQRRSDRMKRPPPPAFSATSCRSSRCDAFRFARGTSRRTRSSRDDSACSSLRADVVRLEHD